MSFISNLSLAHNLITVVESEHQGEGLTFQSVKTALRWT